MNENENDFKYLTIALNDHGGYEESSPKIFNSIELNCNYNNEDVKTFLISDDLFFVYSVPHNFKHMETEVPQPITTKMSNPSSQKFVSQMNKESNQKVLQNQGELIKTKTKHQLTMLYKQLAGLLNLLNKNNLYNTNTPLESTVFINIDKIACDNTIKKDLNEKLIELNKNIDKLGKTTTTGTTTGKENILSNIKEKLLQITNSINKNINYNNIKDEFKKTFLNLKTNLSHVLHGTIPYYEYIVSGENKFYEKEYFNENSYSYTLSPKIDLISTNIGNNESFIGVLNNVIEEIIKKNKENEQLNSDCSIEILQIEILQNFVIKLESVKSKNIIPYLTSELLMVLYIIYEHYKGNCFITVNANHCRTCIDGGKIRHKVRRNKKVKTKKRKMKMNMNRKKSKKTNKRRNKK